jgi:hypothetical protein
VQFSIHLKQAGSLTVILKEIWTVLCMVENPKFLLLGVFEKSQTATISFIMSVCLTTWNNLALNDSFSRNLMYDCFLNICGENSSLIKM